MRKILKVHNVGSTKIQYNRRIEDQERNKSINKIRKYIKQIKDRRTRERRIKEMDKLKNESRRKSMEDDRKMSKKNPNNSH